MFQRDPRAGAFLGGDRVSGQDIRDQNGKYIRIFTVKSTLTMLQSIISYRCAVHRKHCKKLSRSSGSR